MDWSVVGAEREPKNSTGGRKVFGNQANKGLKQGGRVILAGLGDLLPLFSLSPPLFMKRHLSQHQR